MELKLHDMFCTSTLRDRETALSVIKAVSRVPETSAVVLDFSKIIFASRSFCNELLIGLKDKKNVNFNNISEEVKNMMIASLKKPYICSNPPHKNRSY